MSQSVMSFKLMTKASATARGLMFLATLLTFSQPAWASFDGLPNSIGCYQQQITSLGSECRLLEVYDQLAIDKMSVNESIDLAEYCACKLANLDWDTAFDQPSTRYVESMVMAVINNETHHDKYPDFFWSDIDVIVNGISIYVSTKDYFDKRFKDPSWAALSAEEVDRIVQLRNIRNVCLRVSRDRMKLYRYLENLERFNPMVFFQLLEINQATNMIYQASKACKVFLNHRLKDFKLRPDNREFNVVDKLSLNSNEMASYNMIASNDIDEALKDSSVWLINCSLWQTEKLSLDQLEIECPMMVSGEMPINWIERHPLPSNRALMALKCGCQLLLHNATWSEVIKDRNLDVMSKTITQYLNHHRLPEWEDAPEWSIYAWFNDMMEKFQKNKNLAIKEVIKYSRDDQDPTSAINSSTNDEEKAVKLLRRGCNRIMLAKEANDKSQLDDIKLIRYLDNLRYISQDPLFVFHLTLQDSNLFKLHALSKMCEPFVG